MKILEYYRVQVPDMSCLECIFFQEHSPCFRLLRNYHMTCIDQDKNGNAMGFYVIKRKERLISYNINIKIL